MVVDRARADHGEIGEDSARLGVARRLGSFPDSKID
jgi:hypothetical protein